MKAPVGSATPAMPATADAPPAGRPRSDADRRFGLALAAATGVALVNGLVGIGANSVARDEGFSISTSLRSWSSLVRLSVHTETNAWLYAFALKAWSAFGTGPGALRVPSTLAFVATVPLTALLARRLFGARVGAITAFTVALNGSLLMFAHQIRGYAFGVALAVASTLVFVAEVRRPRRGTLVGWVALAVLSSQAQLHTFSVVLPHVVALAALPAARRLWRRRLGALAVGAAVVVPIALAISRHEEGQGLFSLRLGVFRDVLYTFAGRGGVVGVAAFGVAGLGVLALVRRGWRAGPGDERFAAALLGAWVAVPFAALVSVSLALQPTLIGRYLLFCVPAMAVAMALVVDRLMTVGGARRPLAVVAAVLLAAGAARGSLSWHLDSHTERWNEVAAYVFDHGRADDRLVVANDSTRLFFEYERGERSAEPAGPAPGYPAEPWGDYETGDQRYASPTAAELAAVAEGAPRLWVVVGHDHDNTDVMDERLAALAPQFRLVETRSFPVAIDVLLYERVRP